MIDCCEKAGALECEWQRQGVGAGTMRNRMAHLRWWAKTTGKIGVLQGDNVSHGIGTDARGAS